MSPTRSARIQRTGKSHRTHNLGLIERDHRLRRTPRRFRSDPAANQNHFVLLKESKPPAAGFLLAERASL